MDILARISSNIKIEIYTIYLILEKLPLEIYIQLDRTSELSGQLLTLDITTALVPATMQVQIFSLPEIKSI